MSQYGFIGCGNMGGAIAKAIYASGEKGILLSNRTLSKAQALCDAIEGEVSTNCAIAECAKYIFLGVKPQMMADVLGEIAPVLKSRKDSFVLISMAAGLTIDKINQMANGCYPVIRIMPNTPVEIGKGVILYDANSLVAKEDEEEFVSALKYSRSIQLREYPSLTEMKSAIENIFLAIILPNKDLKGPMPQKQKQIFFP